jgi:hypothetical protein
MQQETNDSKPKNKNTNNNKKKINTPITKNSTNKKRKRKASGDKKNNASKLASQLLPKLGVKTPHSSLPPLRIKKVKEPLVTCAYCGKVIENIASAIKPDENTVFHFDCMLEKLTKEEKLADGEKISYIGRGTFAIVGKNEQNKMAFRKTIEVEKSEAFTQMKKYIEGTKI